jgi:hypothetical protein
VLVSGMERQGSGAIGYVMARSSQKHGCLECRRRRLLRGSGENGGGVKQPATARRQLKQVSFGLRFGKAQRTILPSLDDEVYQIMG